MDLPNKLDLYFDGSCLPKNPGGIAGYGWRLVSEGSEVANDSGEVCRGEGATNNIAEWAALRNGLLFLKEKQWKGQLDIYGDSQLVIKQLNNEYRVKKETLLPYYNECHSLLKEINWTANWIPREKNNECDVLSKKTSNEN